MPLQKVSNIAPASQQPKAILSPTFCVCLVSTSHGMAFSCRSRCQSVACRGNIGALGDRIARAGPATGIADHESAAIDQNCRIGSLSNRVTTLARSPPRAGRAWLKTVAIEADDPFCPVKSNRLTGPLPPKPLENSGIFNLVEILRTIRCTMRPCSFVRPRAESRADAGYILWPASKGEPAAREQKFIWSLNRQ
jgi:hypothetical protein